MIEEMYISFATKKAICRFCTRDTINDVYCPACLEKQSLKDARTVENVCPKCLMCPLCFNKVGVNKYIKDGQKIYYHNCLGCEWDSIGIGVTAPQVMDIFAKFTFTSQLKNKDKNKVFGCTLSHLKQTQEMIMKREKREIRQKKQKNLAENRDASKMKEKYTKDMLVADEEVRHQFYKTFGQDIGTSITQQIIDGNIVPKDFDKDALQDGFKDYCDNISTDDEELDLDKELETNFDFDKITSFEQRQKDTFAQPRLKSVLQPLTYPLLPYVTKACRETDKYVVRPKLHVSQGDSYFEIDHMLMKNFPMVTIRSIDAREASKCDVYLRITNPNMSVCIVQLSALAPKQTGYINPNCDIQIPNGKISIDFHNDLIGSGELDMSTDIGKVESQEEDEPFIYKNEKNYLLLKLPIKMHSDLNLTKEHIRFGFNLTTKFEREDIYEVEVPVFINCGTGKLSKK